MIKKFYDMMSCRQDIEDLQSSQSSGDTRKRSFDKKKRCLARYEGWMETNSVATSIQIPMLSRKKEHWLKLPIEQKRSSFPLWNYSTCQKRVLSCTQRMRPDSSLTPNSFWYDCEEDTCREKSRQYVISLAQFLMNDRCSMDLDKYDQHEFRWPLWALLSDRMSHTDCSARFSLS